MLTIGHSNHAIEQFMELLKRHGVDVVADIRSYPYSKFSPHYDQARLKSVLEAAGILYAYLGDHLGGRPDGGQFYDPAGHVLYAKVATTGFFLQGIERLERGIRRYRMPAILCSEENPSVCHRRLLVARVLTDRGTAVSHIRGDGSLQPEEELRAAERLPQLALFTAPEDDTWKSIPSVLRRKVHNSFSAH
jgi:uncharacterized protein (DUF488 family)